MSKNVPANAVLAETSHWDTMAVATTIANQLQMARPDAVDKLEASKATWRKHWPKDLKSGQPSLSQLTLMGDWFLCLYFLSLPQGHGSFRPGVFDA
jgi:hypothetical protein